MALAITLPAALTAAGITGQAADQLAEATRQSAGTTIAQLRAQGAASPFGDQTAATVDALVTGFTDATRWALLIATAFLLLGLAGAWRLRRAAGAASPQVR